MINTYAVMNQKNGVNKLDDFPTPPWAVRAFMEQSGIGDIIQKNKSTVLEPAANRGYMANVLKEYTPNVICHDVYDYGYPLETIQDYISPMAQLPQVDYMITNPPFKIAHEFIKQGTKHARIVCVLVRTNFLEGISRYKTLYSQRPPAQFWQYAERVPIHQSRLDPKGSTATSYGWMVYYNSELTKETTLKWIEPCRKKYERDSDYLEVIFPCHF